MKRSTSKLLEQFHRLGEDGHFGDAARAATGRYEELNNDLARALIYVNDLYRSDDNNVEAISARDLITQVLLLAYRDAKAKDAKVAESFATALIEDYPGASGSLLLPRWIALAEASIAFKTEATSGNPSMIWQHTSKLVLSGNEFLDGLIGLLIIVWRCVLNKSTNANVIGNSYGSKVDELAKLTNGDDGVFYLLLRMAKPKLRNGIAHGTAWLDSDEAKVRFLEGRQDKTEHEMDLTEFMALAALASYLGQAYIAMIAVIVALESDDSVARSLLPKHLLRLVCESK